MNIVTDFLGLALIAACIFIIGIFLKDFMHFCVKETDDKKPGGKGQKKVRRREPSITYRIRYKGKVLEEGSIAASELPVQFGRAKGSGNDIIVAPEGIAAETLQAISRTWFYIQKDSSGYLTVYSADASVNGHKKMAAKPNLVVLKEGQMKAELAVRLDSEVVLKAKDLLMILSVEA